MEYLFLVSAVFLACLPAVRNWNKALALAFCHIFGFAILLDLFADLPKKIDDYFLFVTLFLASSMCWFWPLVILATIVYKDFKHERVEKI